MARSRDHLFHGKNQQFVTRHSYDLGNGFFVGTNNSEAEVESWLRKAVEEAGLTWGVDFKVINSPRRQLRSAA